MAIRVFIVLLYPPAAIGCTVLFLVLLDMAIAGNG